MGHHRNHYTNLLQDTKYLDVDAGFTCNFKTENGNIEATLMGILTKNIILFYFNKKLYILGRKK